MIDNERATEIVIYDDRPLRPSIRLKAFTTPTVAKIVKENSERRKHEQHINAGYTQAVSQTLNSKIVIKLEAADAINRALGDISYPSPLPVRRKRRERQTRSIVLVVLHQIKDYGDWNEAKRQ